MFFQTLLFWLLLLLFLIPIVITGIIILRKTSLIDRYELLIPTGSIFGIALFTFFINLFSFIEAGIPAIFIAFIAVIVLGTLTYKATIKTSSISFPTGKSLLLYLSSVLIWAIFIYWKGNNALIGSDTNLYYAIAHTFLKGNFPPLAPWQPDVPLSYHLGASQLLAAFYLFTNLSFEFLHVFLSCFFILLCSQFIIWIWQRHKTVSSFIIGNLFAVIILISFGFFKLIIPILPIQFPQISNFRDLFLWIRGLPTVNESIEVYGGAINLDALIYFIFHSFGLALTLSLIAITFFQRKDKPYLSWVVLGVGLASLALINESIFVFLAPAIFLAQILLGIINRDIKKNMKAAILVLITTLLIIIFQGGVITNTIFSNPNVEKSILVFPSPTDSKEDFINYHYFQEVSKLLSARDQWLPFRWFSIGTELLILIPILLISFIENKREKLFILVFFISGLFSLVAYNFIVPKFLAANGNRLLGFAFVFLSLATSFSIQFLVNKFKNLTRFVLTGALVILIVIPTVLPPLVLLSKNRFSEKKLVPREQPKTEGIKWLESNLTFNERVAVLDIRTPHPSGQARVMVHSGVFAPLFQGGFKAYTIEASPEYFDIAISLSPTALKALKISTLLVDSFYFETLPDIRKKQLVNEKYFRKVFENSKNQEWEKVYRIEDRYFLEGREIDKTFFELKDVLPSSGKIYIDNEENFNPEFLRRAIIFSLRNRDIYYLPQSGVYLNVETNINSHPPLKDGNYDYLVLGNTHPQQICRCSTKLIWQGLGDRVFIWEKEE